MNLNNKNIKKRDFNKEQLEFLDKITFNNDIEVEDFKWRIENKGIHIYKIIFKFLQHKSIDTNYENINSLFIYDKRIRKILYNFISFLEEKLRAIIINTYKLDNKELDKVYSSTFSGLIEILHKNELINEDYYNKLKEIINLRNDVFHSKFILIDEDEINSLNIKRIKLLYNYLEPKIQESFLNDVKGILKKGINKEKYLLNKLKMPIKELNIYEILLKGE